MEDAPRILEQALQDRIGVVVDAVTGLEAARTLRKGMVLQYDNVALCVLTFMLVWGLLRKD